jgi:transcriptional regulator with XRE-family HTH domain
MDRRVCRLIGQGSLISFLETAKRQPSLSAIAAVSAGLGVPMSSLVIDVERQIAADLHTSKKGQQ